MLKVVAISILAVLVCSAQEAGSIYDGGWWSKQAPRRKYGFLAGIDDCLTSERSDPNHISSVEDSVNFLDNYYLDGAQNERLIFGVIQATIVKPENPKDPPVANRYPERHGFYDGVWWKWDEDVQLGFIEGYVECLPTGKQLFPKSPRSYVDLVNDWYNADLVRRESEKIVNVLLKFKQRLRE